MKTCGLQDDALRLALWLLGTPQGTGYLGPVYQAEHHSGLLTVLHSSFYFLTVKRTCSLSAVWSTLLQGGSTPTWPPPLLPHSET